MLAEIGKTGGHVVVEHFRPHVSDLAGEWLIRTHPNETLFPLSTKGVSVYYVNDGGAVLRDANGNSLGPVLELEKNFPMTLLGVGRGGLDEHNKDIIECEATLVGRKIGLLRSPRVYENLREIEDMVFKITLRDGRSKFFVTAEARYRDFFKAIAEDDIKGSPAFSIGKIADALHDACADDEDVRGLMFQLFAVAEQGTVPKPQRSEIYKKALRLLCETVDELRGAYHEKATARISPWLAKRKQTEMWQPLDLVDCVMLFLHHSKDTVAEWTRAIVEAELKNQNCFHTVTPMEAKKAIFHDVSVRVFDDGKERIESRAVAVIESDDRYVHKYLFAKSLGYGAAMIVKKNSRGQVQIFPGSYEKTIWNGDRVKYVSVPMTFLIPYIVASLRDAEGADVKTPWGGKNSLTDEDGPLGQNIWHFSKCGQILNGSLSAPYARATKLSLAQITEIVLEGVDAKYCEFRSKIVAAMKARRNQLTS